jgi:hypothetical protein
MHPRSWAALAVLWIALATSVARADSVFANDENSVEDQLADGDIDADDPAPMRLGSLPRTARGESWVSLVGFGKQLLSGQNDVGGMVIVGLALDRIAADSLNRVSDSARPLPVPTPPPPVAPTPAPRPVLVAPSLARACVAAALRASGLGVDDTRIDELVGRSRASAWLPETRMRAMRLVADTARATTLATTDGTSYYDTVGSHLVLELRLTWRFDRLIFAGDEPALERTRLQQQEARSRMAVRTLEVLFAWKRAEVDVQAASVGSPEELQARLRASEALATLDVMTGGWFSRRGD